MEVRLRERANVFTVTGLMGLSRQEFDSVMKQVLEKMNLDSQLVFPEAGTRYGYPEIAPEGAWGIAFDKLPRTRVPVTEIRPTNKSADRANLELMLGEWGIIQQQCSDAFLHSDPVAMERQREQDDKVAAAQMTITPIIGLRGVQGVDGDIVGDLGRRKDAEAMRSKPPRQRDRVSMPDLGMPPMSEEEQRLENEDLIRSKGTSPGVINPYKDWNN